MIQVLRRSIWAGDPQSRARDSSAAMIVRTVGTVRAGVYFFPPPVFLRQKPCRQQRECLMVVPSNPIANLILGQPRIALGPPQAFLDPMLGFVRVHSGKLILSGFQGAR